MALFDKFVGPPSRDKFAAQLMAALKAAGDPRTGVYEKDEFRIRFNKDTEHLTVVNLENHYSEHVSLPRADRTKHLRAVVRGILSYAKDAPYEFDDARPDIRVAVRSRFTFEFTSMECEANGTESHDCPCRLIGDHLGAYIAFDLPEAVRYLHARDLVDWGVSFQEAFEIGLQNVIELDFMVGSIEGRTYVSTTNDNYDTTRMLNIDLIRKLEVQGRHLAMVPNRDTLVVTGEDDIEGQEAMLKIAEQAFADPRPMCGIPVVLDGDEWETWTPPADHPLAQRYSQLAITQLSGDYNTQKELLDAAHERQGIDQFVASFVGVEDKESGEVFSYAVWSKGVETLLPQSDRVMFFDPEKELVAANSWSRVQEIVGHLMKPMDLYPPRFRVEGFPTEDELRAIGLVGIPEGS